MDQTLHSLDICPIDNATMQYSEAQRLIATSHTADVHWARHRFQAAPHHFVDRRMPSTVLVQPWQEPYRCRIGSGRWRRIPAGQAIVIPAGFRHTIECTRTILVSAAHVAYTMLGGLDPLSLYTVPLMLPHTLVENVDALLEQLARRGQEQDSLPVGPGIRRQAAAFSLLDLIVQHARPAHDAHQRLQGMHLLQPLLVYIEDHLDETLTRDLLASRLHLSASQFHKVFKDTIGVPPMRYLQQRRLSKAMDLLMQGSYNISEVANRVGYADPFLFSRRFKAHFGHPPSQAATISRTITAAKQAD